MDKILVSTPCFIDYFVNEMNVPKEKLKLVRQPAMISQKEGNAIVYKHKYNFVYADNIGKVQELSSIILAFKKLKDFDICFHILGSGSELNKTLKLIKDNNLENIVVYEGVVPSNQVENYLVNADAAVICLNKGSTVVSKTIPNKLITYLSFKKPAIGIISGDGKDLLINNSNPWVTENNDPEEICNIIKDFILNKSKHKEAIAKLSSFYNNEYSFSKIMDQIEDELIKASTK